MIELRFVVDFDNCVRWSGCELNEAGLFEFAIFSEGETHCDEHQDKNNHNYRDTHKDICSDDSDILSTFRFFAIHRMDIL